MHYKSIDVHLSAIDFACFIGFSEDCRDGKSVFSTQDRGIKRHLLTILYTTPSHEKVRTTNYH